MLGVLCRFLCTSSALERLLDCLRSFRVNRLDAVNTRLANMGRCLTTGNFNKPKVNFTKAGVIVVLCLGLCRPLLADAETSLIIAGGTQEASGIEEAAWCC